MSVSDYCKNAPVTARPDESVRDAAKRMKQLGVGALVVVDDQERPVGVVTDRDVIQKVVRRRLSPDSTLLSSVMSPDVVSVWSDVPLVRVFHRMRHDGVRRVLAVDSDGKVIGILTYDDVLPLVAKELSLAAQVVSAQAPGVQLA
jgi:CBS domain-containing protein